MKFVRLKHASVAVLDAPACPVLTRYVERSELIDEPDAPDFQLSQTGNGLQLIWNRLGQKPLEYQLDFEKLARQQRSFPTAKQGAFNQALGKKSKSIIDATGGWAGDAMLMCLQGYEVVIIERLPLMAALIEEAFLRLAKTEWAEDNRACIPRIEWGNATELLPVIATQADCVYLDPMFPAKKKKKAASNKQMQLLQWLAGPDSDAAELAKVARDSCSRVAVKRPDYAEPLLANPTTQFSSKLVHYDVYV